MDQAPLVVALTDHERFRSCADAALELCRGAPAGTVALVLRDREASIEERLRWGHELRAITQGTGQLFWVADRVDLAQALGADGVHLPSDGLTPHQCRQVWSGSISRAWHDWQVLSDDDLQALDSLLVSPVMAERKGRPPLGLEGLRHATGAVVERASHVAPYALGGVGGRDLLACLAAGARGIAVIGAAWDPLERANLLDAIGSARPVQM